MYIHIQFYSCYFLNVLYSWMTIEFVSKIFTFRVFLLTSELRLAKTYALLLKILTYIEQLILLEHD